jgi:hypothetical protein
MSKTKTTTKAPRLRPERGLAIGLNNYNGFAPTLSGCENDAKDWAAALRSRGFEVSTLINQQATKRAILEGIERLVDLTRSGETAVITFSGHGTWVPDEDGDEPDGRDEAICPYDLPDGVITDDELYERFAAARRGARIVFISDSCHSGSVMRFADLEAADTKRQIRFVPPSVFLSKREAKAAEPLLKAPVKGVIRPPEGLLISGCADPEYSYDAWFNRRPNGAFTYVALKALDRLPPKGTYRDWHALIRDPQNGLPSIQFPQTPQIDGAYHHQRWPVFQSLTG